MGTKTEPATGARGAVHIGRESSFGTPVQPDHVIDFTGEGISADENTIESESIRADRGRHKLIKGNLDVNGNIDYELSAQGYGELIYNALGDYIEAPMCDGGIRARVKSDGIKTVSGPSTDKDIITFAQDHNTRFDETSDNFAVVYRDSNGELAYDNNSSSGYTYDGYTDQASSYMKRVTADGGTAQFSGGSPISETDSNGNDPSAGDVDAIEVAPVKDRNGNEVAPDFNPEGGEVKVEVPGSAGGTMKTYQYYESAEHSSNTNHMILYFDQNALTDTDFSEAGQEIRGEAGFAVSTGGFAMSTSGPDLIKPGTFYYKFDSSWSNVYTHHFERGEKLPEGLTVEVDRDAAIFIYTGCKIDTAEWTFDSEAIVTGSFDLIGQREIVTGELAESVAPDDEEILLKGDKTDLFPNPSNIEPSEVMISIGQETEILYDSGRGSIADGNNNPHYDSANDVTSIVIHSTDDGDPADNTVQNFHPQGSSVVVRTSTKVKDTNLIEGNITPVTSFESNVYQDGYWEEVLSGSLTLNNNLNGDKFGLGSRQRLQLAEEDAVVEGSVTMEFDDGKHYKRFVEGDFFTTEFKCILEADDSEIGNTGVLHQVHFIAPKCQYDGNTPTVDDTSFISHDMPFTSIVDDDLNTTDLVIITVSSEPDDVK